MKKTLLLALALFATIGLYAQQPGPQLPKTMTEYEKGTTKNSENSRRIMVIATDSMIPYFSARR